MKSETVTCNTIKLRKIQIYYIIYYICNCSVWKCLSALMNVCLVWFIMFHQHSFNSENNKTIRNTFSIKQFGSRPGPNCVGPDLNPNCLRETSSLISIQNCFWLTLADKELTSFFIFAAFYLFQLSMHLMGYSFWLDALILEWYIIYIEGSQLINSKLNYLRIPFFIHVVANSVDPDEMRHFV